MFSKVPVSNEWTYEMVYQNMTAGDWEEAKGHNSERPEVYSSPSLTEGSSMGPSSSSFLGPSTESSTDPPQDLPQTPKQEGP